MNRGAFTCEMLVLRIGKGQGDGFIQSQGAYGRQGVGRAGHAVAETAARGIQDHADFFFGKADGAGHGTDVAVQVLAFAMNDHGACFIQVSLHGIRLDGQVGLAAGTEASCHDMGGFVHDGSGAFPLEKGLLEVDIGSAFVDLLRVGSSSVDKVQIFRQGLEIDADGSGGLAGLFPGDGCDNGHHVAVPKDFFIADDRTVQSVAIAAYDAEYGDQPVGAFDILRGDDFDNTRHAFGLGKVYPLDSGMMLFPHNDSQMQGVRGELLRQIIAEVARAEYLGQRSGFSDTRCRIAFRLW